jgi:hypothetical protein
MYNHISGGQTHKLHPCPRNITVEVVYSYGLLNFVASVCMERLNLQGGTSFVPNNKGCHECGCCQRLPTT